MSEVYLKPCPCKRTYPQLWIDYKGKFYRCPFCDRNSPAAKTESQARIIWNSYFKGE